MNKKVDGYIEKQKPLQQNICKELRKIFFKNFSDLKEVMKYGVPYYNDSFYMLALKDHVNFGFSIKNFSEAEIESFQGQGKTVKVIELRSVEEIDKKKIIKILNQVLEFK